MESGEVTDIEGVSSVSRTMFGTDTEFRSRIACKRMSRFEAHVILVSSGASSSRGDMAEGSGSSSRPAKRLAGTRNKSLMADVNEASRGDNGSVGSGRCANGSSRR